MYGGIKGYKEHSNDYNIDNDLKIRVKMLALKLENLVKKKLFQNKNHFLMKLLNENFENNKVSLSTKILTHLIRKKQLQSKQKAFNDIHSLFLKNKRSQKKQIDIGKVPAFVDMLE